MAKFDFTQTFEKIGKIFRQALSKGVIQQKGIDGGAYSPPKPSTLRARRSLSGKKASSSTKRLYVTGDLYKEAFGYTASRNNVKIFARPVSGPDGISYDRLIEYNSRGQARVNRHIDNPPLVFPTDGNEVLLMGNEMKQAMNIFRIDAKRQIKDMAKMNIKVRLRVG